MGKSRKEAPVIRCEIVTSTSAAAASLAEIAAKCAHTTGHVLVPVKLEAQRPVKQPLLTLLLPLELAGAQNEVWCLACRLACFCPDARISVLVQAAEAFPKQKKRKTRRKEQSAPDPDLVAV